jgi:hypothetical protein
MAIGGGWLLTELNFGPGVNWIWTMGLLAAGVVVFIIGGGVDKVSIVLGPFLIACGLLSIVRQSGLLPINIEMPCLVILGGFLFLVAQHPRVPAPKWYISTPPK